MEILHTARGDTLLLSGYSQLKQGTYLIRLNGDDLTENLDKEDDKNHHHQGLDKFGTALIEAFASEIISRNTEDPCSEAD